MLIWKQIHMVGDKMKLKMAVERYISATISESDVQVTVHRDKFL